MLNLRNEYSSIYDYLQYSSLHENVLQHHLLAKIWASLARQPKEFIGYNFTIMNSSNFTDYFTPIEASFITFVMLLATIMTIFGNFVVLFYVCPKIAIKTVAGGLMTNLAMVDILVGCFLMPFNAVSFLCSKYYLSGNICQFFAFLNTTLCIVSTLTLSTISLDRCICITKPLQYHSIFTIRSIRLIIPLLWIMAVVIASLPFQQVGRYAYVSHEFQCWILPSESRQIIVILLTVLCLCVTMILISYFLIYKAARKTKRRIASVHSITNNNSRMRQYDYKTAKTMLLIVGLFLICWIPRTVLLLWYTHNDSSTLHAIWPLLCTWLALINSTLNPFIYCIHNSYYRGILMYALKKQCCSRCSRTHHVMVHNFPLSMYNN